MLRAGAVRLSVVVCIAAVAVVALACVETNLTAVEHERLALTAGPETAAAHRAEARRLRELEESRCVGIPVARRDADPLVDAAEVLSVRRLESQRPRSGAQLSGVVLVVRPRAA